MKKNNITKKKLSQDIGIGINQIKYWETHGSHPKADVAKKIADYFGVSVGYLLGEEDKDVSDDLEVAKALDVVEDKHIFMIPLYESVSAGFGVYASDCIEDYMPAYFKNPADAQESLWIRVRGDSMSPTIEDGDIIQVHRQETVDNGSIAVVLIDGDEGLVKRLQFVSNGVELHSINPMYPTQRFVGDGAKRVRVVGLVIHALKGINGNAVNSAKMEENKKELLDFIEKMDSDELREFNKIYKEYMNAKK
jgi:repressor LexA